MAPKPLEYNATLAERVDISDKLAIFRIKPDAAPSLENGRWFLGGQYMTIGLNNEEKPELGSVRRPMSIASPPQDAEVIDFYIRWVGHPESDNPLTHLLWKIKAGDRCFLRPAAVGKFTVEDTVGQEDPRLRIYVGAGTGLAPFTSMVDSFVRDDAGADLSKHAILHGASYPNELGYKAHLEKLAAENGMKYLATISRPKEAPEWSGFTGRVEDFFKAERLDSTEDALGLERGGLTGDNATIFICGLMGTIKETVERMLHRGFIPDNRKIRRALEIPEEQKANLFWEQYDNTPVIDTKDPAEVARVKALMAG